MGKILNTVTVLTLLTCEQSLTAQAAPAMRAVVRLGNMGKEAVVLPCLTEAEANAHAKAKGNERTFGWQLHSDEFTCHRGPHASYCTPNGDKPRFIDFFFSREEACQAFAAAISPACADQPPELCERFLEGYLSRQGGDSSFVSN